LHWQEAQMTVTQSQPTAEQRSEVAHRYDEELKKVREEEKELAILLRQTEGEVERNTARRDQALQRVREMEANIEQYSRPEIGPIYTSAHAAELRVYVMKGQLEQLQAKRESIARLTKALNDLLPLTSRQPVAAPAIGIAAASAVTSPTLSRTATMNIIQAQEEERQRLSRQMHDGPAQSLTNLILQAEICERFMAIDAIRGKAELANLKNMVNGTFRSVREFIFDLRPMILDDLGLVPTLKRYIANFQDKNRISATLTVTGKDRRLPQVLEVSLFRTIQECMNNVSEHSKATDVQVSLDLRDEARVRVVVEDNGIGFSVVTVLQAARERATLGVANMLDRIESLGGTVHFDSSPGRGARVEILAPIG
jgi:two-component system sensor histidine kinase DegS